MARALKVGLALSAALSGAGAASGLLTPVLSIHSGVLSVYVGAFSLVYASAAGRSARVAPALLLIPALMAASAVASLLALRRVHAYLLMASAIASASALVVLIDVAYIIDTMVLGRASALTVPLSNGLLYLFVDYRLTPGPVTVLALAATIASWFNYLYHEGRTIVVTIRECLELEARRRYGVSFEELRASRPGIARAMEDYARFGALCWPVIVEEEARKLSLATTRHESNRASRPPPHLKG